MKFSDIPSHFQAKQRIIDMVDNDRFPHALLLEGPEGIGKFALARATAQYIHCENRQKGDSCGVCPSCLQHQSFNHIDTHFSFPVVKTKKIKEPVSDDFIDQWKEFLTESPFMDFSKWVPDSSSANTAPIIYVYESAGLIQKLSYTAHRARYKIVLMWLPEKMNTEAANKLLKQLEEPHPDTIFIMTSDNPGEVLPTIYSRTQRISLKRLPDDVVAQYLRSVYHTDDAESLSIAHLANGSIPAAIDLISIRDESREFLELFISLMRLAYTRNIFKLKEWCSDVAALGRNQILNFLEYCMRLIRENFIYNLNRPDLNYLNADERAFSVNFARFVNERNVIGIMEEMDSASRDIAGNGNAKIVLFDLAVRMIMLLKS